ncbi:MAG: M64 family metallopeptidase, partial [Candidatus Aminicenantes bacterium]|nr:M64 family metallopeptidase [Candidatus Aminicenantes bacterium]
AVFAERSKNRQAQKDEIERAKQNKLSDAKVKAIEDKYRKLDQEIMKKVADIRKQYAQLEDKVGVFEGAGYASKGLYRPMIYCLMISSPKQEFCLVCKQAIRRMIDFYAGRSD